MASFVYAKFLENGFTGTTFNWGSDDFRAELLDDTYDEALGGTKQDTHNDRADVAAEVCSDSAETALAGESAAAINATSNLVEFGVTAAPGVTFSSVAGGDTAGGVAVYKHVDGVAGNDLLVSWNKFTGDVSTNGSDIEVTFASNLVLTLNYNPS